MTDDGVYRLEGGENPYDDRVNAITVAEAKAAEAGEPVTVEQKLLRTFEPAVRVFPDGGQEEID